MLLAGAYSVAASIPAFRHADSMSAAAGSAGHAAARARASRRHARARHATLAAYVGVSALATGWGELAAINAATFLALDAVHAALARGRVRWSPGFTVALLCVGRVCVASSAGQYWLFGYAACFVAYGSALVREIVRGRLPYLSKREAGAIVFFGHDAKGAASAGPGRDANDASGMPEWALGALSFLFLLLLLIAAYTQPPALPLPRISVLGGGEWPIYVFGVLGFLLVVVMGLAEATARAAYLARQNLLRGAARDVYLARFVTRPTRRARHTQTHNRAVQPALFSVTLNPAWSRRHSPS